MATQGLNCVYPKSSPMPLPPAQSTSGLKLTPETTSSFQPQTQLQSAIASTVGSMTHSSGSAIPLRDDSSNNSTTTTFPSPQTLAALFTNPSLLPTSSTMPYPQFFTSGLTQEEQQHICMSQLKQEQLKHQQHQQHLVRMSQLQQQQQQAKSLLPSTPIVFKARQPGPASFRANQSPIISPSISFRTSSLATSPSAFKANLPSTSTPFKANLPSPYNANSQYLHLAMLVCNTFRGKLFPCEHCRYVTDRRNNLKRHIATMHQACDKRLECCGVPFPTKASLREHIAIFHHNGYSCAFCGRRFCRKALLKRHLAVHNGQKDFVCPHCDYATSHKSNLERHKRIHERSASGEAMSDFDNMDNTDTVVGDDDIIHHDECGDNDTADGCENNGSKKKNDNENNQDDDNDDDEDNHVDVGVGVNNSNNNNSYKNHELYSFLDKSKSFNGSIAANYGLFHDPRLGLPVQRLVDWKSHFSPLHSTSGLMPTIRSSMFDKLNANKTFTSIDTLLSKAKPTTIIDQLTYEQTSKFKNNQHNNNNKDNEKKNNNNNDNNNINVQSSEETLKSSNDDSDTDIDIDIMEESALKDTDDEQNYIKTPSTSVAVDKGFYDVSAPCSYEEGPLNLVKVKH